MTSAENEPQVRPTPSVQARSWRSLMADPSTVAALLVVVCAAVFFVIALMNRDDPSTHDHPGTDVVADEAGAADSAHDHSSHDHAESNAVTDDAGASDSAHDHSTHDHAEDLGETFASTERIAPPEACRTIIGCDDAGPKPQNPGDRGGWAQLMTLGVVALGLAFIATKVVRATRRTRATEH